MRYNDVEIQKGDIVTFSYDSFGKRGLPTNAKIIRNRPELSWMNVIYNFSREKYNKSLNSMFVFSISYSLILSFILIVIFFLFYSYLIISSDVTMNSLNEIVARNPQGYWTNSQDEGEEGPSNLRKFFLDIAKQRNMDPLVPDNWYSMRNRELRQYKVILLYNSFL